MNRQATIDDLRRILREAAGDDDIADLDGDVLDHSFEDLGYDSLALLETGTRLQREYGIKLDDATVIDAVTPRLLLGAVNVQLARVGAS